MKKYFTIILLTFFGTGAAYAQIDTLKFIEEYIKSSASGVLPDDIDIIFGQPAAVPEPFQLNEKTKEIANSGNFDNKLINKPGASLETLTFTNAGATGHTGPTQTEVNTAYSSTTLEGKVTINDQGIQEWTVPHTMTYTIEAWGAQGGGTGGTPGKGARMKGDFNLTKDEVIKIVVGQMGIAETDYYIDGYAGGGGGGTFVIKTPYNNTASILLIAGGGGGSGVAGYAGYGGITSETDSNTGSAGNGGTPGSNGNSGAGFSGNGVLGGHNGETIAYSFVNGAVGGVGHSGGGTGYGGFGGGAGDAYADGGGGGGYSGGNAETNYYGGFGAGSYNSGSNQDNTADTRESHGQIIITYSPSPSIASVSLASDNSTIAVTFSEAVYNATGGSGALEADDFAFSISGGTATLSSTTPTSIDPNGNVYTLGIGLSGTPNGSETLTVNPVDDSIYDAADLEASTSQSNNTATLNEKILPTISSVSVESDNSTIAVTFSEAVYNATGGSG
ncbi:MAG: glycine-rich protein, partial [Candidatus Marinimicrobia bacterium]|nr:glycine-rich protein [Candidatus Neomarinimicrobiota bacterium]